MEVLGRWLEEVGRKSSDGSVLSKGMDDEMGEEGECWAALANTLAFPFFSFFFALVIMILLCLTASWGIRR